MAPDFGVLFAKGWFVDDCCDFSAEIISIHVYVVVHYFGRIFCHCCCCGLFMAILFVKNASMASFDACCELVFSDSANGVSKCFSIACQFYFASKWLVK